METIKFLNRGATVIYPINFARHSHGRDGSFLHFLQRYIVSPTLGLLEIGLTLSLTPAHNQTSHPISAFICSEPSQSRKQISSSTNSGIKRLKSLTSSQGACQRKKKYQVMTRKVTGMRREVVLMEGYLSMMLSGRHYFP